MRLPHCLAAAYTERGGVRRGHGECVELAHLARVSSKLFSARHAENGPFSREVGQNTILATLATECSFARSCAANATHRSSPLVHCSCRPKQVSGPNISLRCPSEGCPPASALAPSPRPIPKSRFVRNRGAARLASKGGLIERPARLGQARLVAFHAALELREESTAPSERDGAPVGAPRGIERARSSRTLAHR